MQANLTNRDAVDVPKPFVKWSHEPPRAADVPLALAQAIHHASLAPTGPCNRVDPDGRLARRHRAPGDYARTDISRTVTGPLSSPMPEQIPGAGYRAYAWTRAIPSSWPAPTIDASGGWDAAVELAESPSTCRYGPPPPPGGNRIGFPEPHPCIPGCPAPPPSAPSALTLAEHDLVLVAGSSVFPDHPNIPGDLLADGT